MYVIYVIMAILFILVSIACYLINKSATREAELIFNSMRSSGQLDILYDELENQLKEGKCDYIILEVKHD